MLEVIGNLWQFPADARCITTNGYVKTNGEAVMGRGCAAESKLRYPKLPHALGIHINARGNIVGLLWEDEIDLICFPVKHHWAEKADLKLIQRSANQLVALTDELGYNVVVLPRPGCGNGHLLWSDVKPILAPILDDRFSVISFK